MCWGLYSAGCAHGKEKEISCTHSKSGQTKLYISNRTKKYVTDLAVPIWQDWVDGLWWFCVLVEGLKGRASNSSITFPCKNNGEKGVSGSPFSLPVVFPTIWAARIWTYLASTTPSILQIKQWWNKLSNGKIYNYTNVPMASNGQKHLSQF